MEKELGQIRLTKVDEGIKIEICGEELTKMCRCCSPDETSQDCCDESEKKDKKGCC
jgi:hypothetical protein